MLADSLFVNKYWFCSGLLGALNNVPIQAKLQYHFTEIQIDYIGANA